MQLLTMYLNFVTKLAEIGFRVFLALLSAMGKAAVWMFQRFDERQWKRKRRR